MSDTEPLWLNRILQDLSEFSAQLLEQGLGKGMAGAKSINASSSLANLLQIIGEFVILVPSCLSELAITEATSGGTLAAQPTPIRAMPSRRPADYVVRDGMALPRFWLREEDTPVLPVAPLRWMIGIGVRLRRQLEVQTSRLSKQIDSARFVRAGTSSWAIADLSMLDQMQGQLVQASEQLRRADAIISRNTGRALTASNHIPRPFPHGRAWQQFRRMASALDHPETQLGRWLGSALRHPVALADIPYLYQRWCGLQILNSARRLGWKPEGELVGALFLGGLIQLKLGDDIVEMWVEPRLSEIHADRIGWKSRRGGELTPDFLFVTGHPGERDAFVLDATLSTSQDYLLAKARYRDQLVGLDPRFVAGVPLLRRPLRAWAAAPIRSIHCDVTDSSGIGGTIPMNAAESSFPGLDAWLADILLHACATRARKNESFVRA